ncbi:hypothetical protein AB0D94_22690 [Streptomyces sp. NPDC048255]|uniref:hypothetical protein n=1 Tax=Streptomyces sp. NPDC048255 TaxID=3154713 RepID=UPI00340E2049
MNIGGLLNHPKAMMSLGGSGDGKGMSYDDAVTKGVPAVAASAGKATVNATGKQYSAMPAGLGRFLRII